MRLIKVAVVNNLYDQAVNANCNPVKLFVN